MSVAELSFEQTGLRRIRALEVRRLLWEGATLLDARGLEEFTQGHLEGARRLAFDAPVAQIRKMLPSRDIPIVCYSNRNGRSTSLACRLLDLSYLYVHMLECGLDQLASTGL